MDKITVDFEVHEEARSASFQFWYPRTEGHVNELLVGLSDVRAADSILIHYDFDRDGYVIQQASRFSWAEGEEIDQDWQEVAFIQAWARDSERP